MFFSRLSKLRCQKLRGASTRSSKTRKMSFSCRREAHFQSLKDPEIDEKSISKSIKLLYALLVAFWWLLGPTWLEKLPKMEPTWLQNRPKFEHSFGSYFGLDVGHIFYGFAPHVETAEVCKNSTNIV